MAEEETQIENFDEVVKSLIVKADPATGQPLPEPKKNEQAEAEAEAKSGDDKEAPRKPAEEGPDTTQESTPEVDESDDEEIDVDTIPLEVIVDGVVKQVTIKELKEKYSYVGAIDKRLQEATESRVVAHQQATQLNEAYNHILARLQSLDNVLAQIEAPKVNMDELRAKDPTRYLFEKERMREAADRRAQVRAEAQRIAAHQEEIQQAALVEYSKNEAYILGQKDPDFANPEIAPKAMKWLSEGAAAIYGYSQPEVYSVTDHRALLVLKDALKWRQLEAKQQNGIQEAKVAPRPLMKPGVKKSAARSTQQKQMDALRAKARETGRVEDVAATLIVRGRR